MKCSICKGKIDSHRTPEGKVYWRHGNNAEPINEGRCCTKCNNIFVLPERMNRIGKGISLRQVLN